MTSNDRFVLCFLASAKTTHSREIQKALLQHNPQATAAEVMPVLTDLKLKGLVSPLGDGSWTITFRGTVEAAGIAAGAK